MGNINASVATVTAIATIVVLGAFSIINLIDRNLKARRREADAADEKLIGRLKEIVEAQGKEIDALKIDLQSNKVETAKVLKENEVLTKILQGRDDRTKEYQEAGFAAMKTLGETHATVNKLVGLMERHLSHIETSLSSNNN